MDINNQIEMVCTNCGNVQATRDLVLLGESSVNYLNHPDEVAICCDNPCYERKSIVLDIAGKLTIDNKIYFNDVNGVCRLRICGFSEEQIEKMKKSSCIDITLMKEGIFENFAAYISIYEKEKKKK